jgi:hypothetical protein
VLESPDISFTIILILVVTALLQSIPTLVIGFGAILCLRKGYQLSATLLLVSVALTLVNHVGALFLSRFAVGSGLFGWGSFAYGTQALSFVSGCLLAAGLLTLIRNATVRAPL